MPFKIRFRTVYLLSSKEKGLAFLEGKGRRRQAVSGLILTFAAVDARERDGGAGRRVCIGQDISVATGLSVL